MSAGTFSYVCSHARELDFVHNGARRCVLCFSRPVVAVGVGLADPQLLRLDGDQALTARGHVVRLERGVVVQSLARVEKLLAIVFHRCDGSLRASERCDAAPHVECRCLGRRGGMRG